MPLDKAGNTLQTARNITLTTNIQTFSDWVGSSDIDDFYKVSLTARSSLNIKLDGLSADANIQLIKDANSNGLADSNETIVGSYKTGTQIDSIIRTLDAGNYFIKVYSKGVDTNYNLKIFQNIAPTSLGFKLNSTSLNPEDTLGINSAWVSDKNGISDISKVDFRLQKSDGTWINVADATKFTVDPNNASRASFSYSLSLETLNLGSGNYTLQGIAYDKSNAASNTVKLKFTIQTSTTTPVSTPTTPVSTSTPDWFSSNLIDQQIKTLARTLAADGNLSRKDMLDIFRSAEDSSVVDANEIADLKALVGATTPFSMQDPVKWLSKRVATDATANMSASDFESKLVGRWFLGTVPPQPVFNGKTLTYTKVTGTLYGSSNEARIGDIDQNQLGDCFFLAGLGATFRRQSNDAGNTSSSVIKSMITDNGDDTYTIRFYSRTSFNPGEAQYVTVDRQIATSIAAKTNNGVLWVALVEKAYAQWQEWRRSFPGYNIIGNGGTIFSALQEITGRAATNYSITTVNFSTLETALANGKAITAARTGSSSQYIVGNHAYSVTNTYINSSGQQRVVVRNPWGVDGKTISGTNDGFIDLSFAEFTQSFNYGISIA